MAWWRKGRASDLWLRGRGFVVMIPPPQSATLGLRPVARKLLLISGSAEGGRLSSPDHTVGEHRTRNFQVAVICKQP